jgi:hypothetical protein
MHLLPASVDLVHMIEGSVVCLSACFLQFYHSIPYSPPLLGEKLPILFVWLPLSLNSRPHLVTQSPCEPYFFTYYPTSFLFFPSTCFYIFKYSLSFTFNSCLPLKHFCSSDFIFTSLLLKLLGQPSSIGNLY